jgi:uncharacterized protein (TIGR02271 family)
MKRFQKRQALLQYAAILLTLAAAPRPLAAATNTSDLPSETTVKVDGSTSMIRTNEEFKQWYEKNFPNREVNFEYDETDAALQSVLKGETDIAAIGRPLTESEKASGLVAVNQPRHKIAIVAGSNNTFTGDLTFRQFAQIFRGEITNWSQVGGSPGQIQLIDRPESSDTRRAFQSYPVFKEAPFKATANAVKLPQDSTEAMIKQLGTRGIGYAIADQVINVPGVRIVPMHKTLPTDPRYPFSQPLAYVYKGPTPNPVAAAFLGYAAAPSASPEPATTTSPSIVQAPATTNVRETETQGFPWLWLLLFPLIGGLLWWLLKNRSSSAIGAAASTVTVPIAPVPKTSTATVIPDLEEQQNIKLYEERLVADKTLQKTGDVAINKRVETKQVQVSVPVETERVVIERTTPTGASAIVDPDTADFNEREFTRMNVYEEVPDIHKEAFVREEVHIRKEVEQTTVEAQEQIRREELDINTDVRPADKNHNLSKRERR